MQRPNQAHRCHSIQAGREQVLTCINEVRREGAEQQQTETRQEGGRGKKYVKMTKADAMKEASSEDETLKMARLPSDERDQPSFPLKSSDYTNANQTDKHKRPDK